MSNIKWQNPISSMQNGNQTTTSKQPFYLYIKIKYPREPPKIYKKYPKNKNIDSDYIIIERSFPSNENQHEVSNL